MKRLIVLSLCYFDAKKALELSNSSFQAAADTFQKCLLKGLFTTNEYEVVVINCAPIGTWPGHYKQLIIKDNISNENGIDVHEVGCINLPFVKQIGRERRLKNLLRQLVRDGDKVLIYSTYLPFLKAATAISDAETTLIVTDLPEYYDYQNVNILKKKARQINNQLIYKCVDKIDKFVLLTRQMTHPLNVNNRPYTVVEGICDTDTEKVDVGKSGDKEILFYSGTLNYKFGVMNLVNSYLRIDDSNLELWICGSGEAAAEIQSLAKENPGIKFYGFCNKKEVMDLRSHATLLINPRENEGEYTKYSFPSKTMEYMASGIPVVMFKLDGIPEEYDSYIFYVDENKEYALQRKIESVLKMNRNERFEFGERARAFVLNNKNEIVQARKISNLLNNEV